MTRKKRTAADDIVRRKPRINPEGRMGRMKLRIAVKKAIRFEAAKVVRRFKKDGGEKLEQQKNAVDHLKPENVEAALLLHKGLRWSKGTSGPQLPGGRWIQVFPKESDRVVVSRIIASSTVAKVVCSLEESGLLCNTRPEKTDNLLGHSRGDVESQGGEEGTISNSEQGSGAESFDSVEDERQQRLMQQQQKHQKQQRGNGGDHTDGIFLSSLAAGNESEDEDKFESLDNASDTNDHITNAERRSKSSKGPTPKKAKNRMGQRARRKQAEAEHGKEAAHLVAGVQKPRSRSDGSRSAVKPTEDKLHPSWEAKRQAKTKMEAAARLKFQGTKITFEE